MRGTLLYYPWVFYVKAGVQLTLRPLVTFLQLTELLVIGRSFLAQNLSKNSRITARSEAFSP